MAFLIRRNLSRAYARWFDIFNRSENPVKFPWASWGAARTVYMRSDYRWLILANDAVEESNDIPDGGVAYAYQPLTPNWAIEFGAEHGSTADGSLFGFLGASWTSGGNAGSSPFTTFFQLLADTTFTSDGSPGTQLYRVYIKYRDKSSQAISTQMSYFMPQAEWRRGVLWTNKTVNRYKILVFNDSTVVLIVNGTVEDVRRISDTRFHFGPDRRAINFKGAAPFDWYISNFSTYDREELPIAAERWQLLYEDTFDRPNTTGGPGNGWTSGGDSNHGITSNAYTMKNPFPTPNDTYRASWINPGLTAATKNVRIEVVLGGGIGVVNDTAHSVIVARTTSAGLGGLGVFIRQGSLLLARIDESIFGSSTSELVKTSTGPASAPSTPVAIGDTIALCIFGDEAWVEQNGNIINYGIGIDALVPHTALTCYVGLVLRRKNFNSSAPIANVRVLLPKPIAA